MALNDIRLIENIAARAPHECIRVEETKLKRVEVRTRLDTRLPKSRAGGQGQYLRSLDYLGRSSETKKVKCDRSKDGRTDGRTNGRTNGRTDGLKDGRTNGRINR